MSPSNQSPAPAELDAPPPADRDLFARFPLALALVTDDGSLRFNDRCRDRFRIAGNEESALRDLAETPGPAWQGLRLRSRDGAQITMHAQAVALPSMTLILLADGPPMASEAEQAQLHRRIEELERISATDYLTGAWNRAHLNRVLQSELARSLRFRQPLSALLIDVDHFKLVNDNRGHQAGDAMLCEMVRLIQRKIRTADQLFRWGGEEFVVLAVSTRYRDAQILADHLRELVASHVFADGAAVTASIGVAEHHGSENAQAWFSRLDAALFAAKNGGRNRVVTDPRGNSDLWVAAPSASPGTGSRDSHGHGTAPINATHHLVELGNRLSAAMWAPPAVYEQAVTALIGALAEHFAGEERRLEACGSTALAGQRRIHAALLAKAAALHATGGSRAPGDARRPLIEFLVNEAVPRPLPGSGRGYCDTPGDCAT